MAGIFKSLDASDIRLTPFRTHKQWYDTVTYKDYYPTVLANPISVSGIYEVSNRAYATDISSSTIIRLNTDDDYTILGTKTIPALSGSVFNFLESNLASLSICPRYIAAYGKDVAGNAGTVTMLDSILYTHPSSGHFTSSILSNIFDVTTIYNTEEVVNGKIVVIAAGAGGITGKNFDQVNGQFYGSQYTFSNSVDVTLNTWFKAVDGNAILADNQDQFLAIAVPPATSPTAVAVQFQGYGYNFEVQHTVSLNESAVGTMPKTILYNNTQQMHYVLMQDGFLYKIKIYDSNLAQTPTKTLIATGVADILQDRANTAGGNAYQSVKTHVVYTNGQIGLDLVQDASGISFEKVIDARQLVALKPKVKATIQFNDPSGSVGIFAGTDDSAAIGESVFFTINPHTYEISDPIHMGATKGDLRISGNNLSKFVGFSSSFNNRFVEFNTNRTSFQQYQADYNPIPSHPSYNQLNTLFDQGNPHFQYYEPITANSKFQRVVHRSINHLFFQDFYNNTKATFGGGNINTQNRFLEDQAQVINLPQTKFGESIQQGSVLINAKYSLLANKNVNVKIVDDIYGNLYVSGGLISSVDGTTLVSASIASNTVGEWPTLNVYKYNGKGPVSFTSSFNKGDWQMESCYHNITLNTQRSGSTPQLLPTSNDLLGVVPIFSSSISSSIVIQPGPILDYKNTYNFENGDFTITMMIQASQASSYNSGSIIIAKQGTSLDSAVDINGNVYTYRADDRSPYRVWLSGSSPQVVFERDNLVQRIRVSGSVQLGKLHHITVMKTGSQLNLYVDGTLSGSAADLSLVAGCSNTGPISIGNLYPLKNRGFDGTIDNVKIYKRALTSAEVSLSHHTLGHNSTIVGTILYNHGMMVLSGVPARFMDITDVYVRGTQTIWEKELTCTVSPGEFNRSNNPTLQIYNAGTNQYEFKPFTTGSEFKPYVTSVGLYDDLGRMVAIAKIASPLQLPSNTDTTIIVRFDT